VITLTHSFAPDAPAEFKEFLLTKQKENGAVNKLYQDSDVRPVAGDDV
jgi:hypothetical protein